jgi:S-adenosylmethionine synthetase
MKNHSNQKKRKERTTMAKYLFTSESVTEGHPDKICDQISDAVLDSILEQDPNGRVACETTITTGMVMVMGEISTSCYVDIPKIARQVIRDIGYDRAKFGFDCDTCGIITSIDEQSCDIALGVDKGLEAKNANSTEEDNGAGDQGMMFGFACDDTPELMPMPISLAHKLAKQLTKVRKDGTLHYLRPDGKTQVTIEYENEVPVAVETIVISNQHSPEVEMEQLRADIKKYVIDPIVPQELMTEQTKIFINPTGRFVIGGPQGDSGLTGRKIIVDTYGGMGRHGGGAFSGKDPTKVDRSAAYAARYVAKNIVAAKLAKKCEVQLAYAIGVAKPVSINVNTFGTGAVADEQLEKAVEKVFDLRPTAIINSLGLRRPIYRQLAAYGHMGREDLGVSWEKTDKVDALLAAVK